MIEGQSRFRQQGAPSATGAGVAAPGAQHPDDEQVTGDCR